MEAGSLEYITDLSTGASVAATVPFNTTTGVARFPIADLQQGYLLPWGVSLDSLEPLTCPN